MTQNYLGSLRLVLLLYGKQKIYRILHWILISAFVASYFYQIYYHTETFFGPHVTLFDVLFLTANNMHITLLFTLYFLHKRGVFEEIVDDINNLTFLRQSSALKTQNLTLLWFFTCILSIAIDMIKPIINSVKNQEFCSNSLETFLYLSKYFVLEVTWSLYINGWMILDTIHFGLVVCLFYNCKKSILNQAFENENLNGNLNGNLSTLKQQITSLLSIKERIEKKVTVAPFVWFADLFIRVSFRIALLALSSNLQTNPIEFVAAAKEAVIQIATQFGLILAISRWNLNCPSTNQIIASLTTDGVSNEVLLLQRMLKELEKGFVIWDVFTLDKKLIVSFASGVVTFSVMIIQLLQPLVQWNHHLAVFSR